jgi:hypothetical protein
MASNLIADINNPLGNGIMHLLASLAKVAAARQNTDDWVAEQKRNRSDRAQARQDRLDELKSARDERTTEREATRTQQQDRWAIEDKRRVAEKSDAEALRIAEDTARAWALDSDNGIAPPEVERSATGAPIDAEHPLLSALRPGLTRRAAAKANEIQRTRVRQDEADAELKALRDEQRQRGLMDLKAKRGDLIEKGLLAPAQVPMADAGAEQQLAAEGKGRRDLANKESRIEVLDAQAQKALAALTGDHGHAGAMGRRSKQDDGVKMALEVLKNHDLPEDVRAAAQQRVRDALIPRTVHPVLLASPEDQAGEVVVPDDEAMIEAGVKKRGLFDIPPAQVKKALELMAQTPGFGGRMSSPTPAAKPAAPAPAKTPLDMYLDAGGFNPAPDSGLSLDELMSDDPTVRNTALRKLQPLERLKTIRALQAAGKK